MSWFVYIVKGRDGSLYTGITTNPPRRVLEHNSKTGAKSLRGRLPVVLIYKEKFPDQKSSAMREREIKSWRREKKLKLIKYSASKGFVKVHKGFTLRDVVTKGR